ncbi:TetR/AcrR family transcriptional regulator [Schaalia vaccimaxillae]|uniref:TetR/AcrR family transcriptional regulator n=1 Tax=Schaalia vaccimaxillae TaxID=183916 RepID=UPI0003B4D959|nr:TetR/AcrR family transcriptional regulator [Schaalia vaccimaxillae]
MATDDARRLLAHALKKQLAQVPLSKVTVRGLCQDAGISRQAFYYHFSTLNDLAVWTFTDEIADRILSHASYEGWSDGFLSMLVWMREHPDQTFAVVRSLSIEDLQLFLHAQLRAMMVVIVNELSEGIKIDEDDRAFIIDHFTLSVLGHTMQWLATRMKADPYVLVERIERILRGGVRRALIKFSEIQ